MSSSNMDPIREIYSRPRQRPWFVSLCIALGFIFLTVAALWFVFVPGLGHPPEAMHRTECKNNLKQIGLALHNYHDKYGTFPPAYIADEHGRRMHSWRVLLLPFVDQQTLYNQYRFDEPWDGPNNRQLLETVVPAYQCPSEYRHQKPQFTANYLAIVGQDTAWPGDRSSSISDFTDGLSNTLLVVEVANSGVHWMEPRDLSTTIMSHTINPSAGQGISSKHTGGANALMGDGAVRFLSQKMPESMLQKLITPNGGEVVEDF